MKSSGNNMTAVCHSTTTITSTVPPPQQFLTSKMNNDEKIANLSSKRDASWPSVLFYIHLNILGMYGIMVLFTNAHLTTVIFTAILSFIGIIGVTCGAHRLFAHQSYEANTLLKLLLMLCQTMAGQVNNQRGWWMEILISVNSKHLKRARTNDFIFKTAESKLNSLSIYSKFNQFIHWIHYYCVYGWIKYSIYSVDLAN